MTAVLVSIIGAPGVGKTTLAEMLAPVLGARLIREDYANNPFLAESYTGDPSSRLPGQLYFLVSRVGQLGTAGFPRTGVHVSDYGFCQDRVYARARLGDEEFGVYDGVHRRLAPLVRPAELTIALDAAVETLRSRIACRGRQFERAMTPDFLAFMRNAYLEIVRDMVPNVLPVNCDAVDFRQPQAFQGIVEQVREHCGLV